MSGWQKPVAEEVGMSHVVDGVAVALLVLGAATWVGGFVTVVVVNRVAGRTLSPTQRVAFFRAFGRTFGAVAGLALLLALVGGGVLMRHHSFDATAIVTVVLAVALVAATAVGVAQARAMTRLRRTVLATELSTERATGPAAGDAATLAFGARNAAVLRSLIGAITVALLTFAVLLAT